MIDRLVAIRGGGRSGVWGGASTEALRFPSRRTGVCRSDGGAQNSVLSEAVYDGETRVEDIRGISVSSDELAVWDWRRSDIPVLVDPEALLLGTVNACAVVDAILAKRNTGTTRDMAACSIGLGPGFRAGNDVDAVVETNRGPDLGRVLWTGTTEVNTGIPGSVMGFTEQRVLRAPASGTVHVLRDITAIVEEGDVVAEVSGTSILAPFKGVVRGMARDGLAVSRGTKIGDIDPRLDTTLCFRVSDKSLAIAGGVLEAILTHITRQDL